MLSLAPRPQVQDLVTKATEIEPRIKVTPKLSPFVQFSSVTQLCPTLCDPMHRSTPGLPVHHQLPEFTQTHAHWVGDTIQPSHPLLSPSPPAPNPSQQQGLFQWDNSSHEVAKVLEFQLQYHCNHCQKPLWSSPAGFLIPKEAKMPTAAVTLQHPNQSSRANFPAGILSWGYKNWPLTHKNCWLSLACQEVSPLYSQCLHISAPCS